MTFWKHFKKKPTPPKPSITGKDGDGIPPIPKTKQDWTVHKQDDNKPSMVPKKQDDNTPSSMVPKKQDDNTPSMVPKKQDDNTPSSMILPKTNQDDNTPSSMILPKTDNNKPSMILPKTNQDDNKQKIIDASKVMNNPTLPLHNDDPNLNKQIKKAIDQQQQQQKKNGFCVTQDGALIQRVQMTDNLTCNGTYYETSKYTSCLYNEKDIQSKDDYKIKDICFNANHKASLFNPTPNNNYDAFCFVIREDTGENACSILKNTVTTTRRSNIPSSVESYIYDISK